MSPLLAAIILGFIQGITEFLPVSSSGHLVLFQEFLPVSGDEVAFDLALHIGTLVPVFIFYRRDLQSMIRDAVAGEGPVADRDGLRLMAWVLLGSVPTAIIGLACEDVCEHLFSSAAPVAVAFAITGVVLFSTTYAPKGQTTERSMVWWQAVLIGIAQGIAITPGISRSGSTIAAALFLGMDREYAARFSFLLSIPAIGGAFLLKARDLELTSATLGPIAVGFVVAAVSGYLALVLLVRLVRSGDFSRFSYYLWAIALVAGGVALSGS